MRWTAGVWGLLVSCVGVGMGAAWARDEGPELAAPTDPPPASEVAPPPAPRNRPLLVVPRPKPADPAPAPIPEPAGDFPSLIGPAEMVGPDPKLRSSPAPGRARRPLVMESVPRDPLRFGPSPDAPAFHDAPPPSGTKPGGRPRLFGWTTPTPTPPPASGRARLDPGSTDEVVVEPKSDPAADATLKRRIERQIQDAVGDRLRSLEVLVVDRRVVVQARAARFWQRRALRKSIEALPALAGYRATVLVDE